MQELKSAKRAIKVNREIHAVLEMLDRIESLQGDDGGPKSFASFARPYWGSFSCTE